MYGQCSVTSEDFSRDIHRLKKISPWEDVSNAVSEKKKKKSNTTEVWKAE